MSYIVPLSNKGGIVVDFLGNTRFSTVRWNNIMRCWVCDFQWNDVVVKSFALRAGTNMLKQFGVPFYLYIVNNAEPILDPGKFTSITAYIIEEGELV
ncbi:hypothetical protein [Pseudomonas laurylsulfatiphila]|uniref:hypothetical protein n=1 Tax=Pseudomonas laurylsulfatiphila TaxID=2011015 RepID=UPI003D1E92BA